MQKRPPLIVLSLAAFASLGAALPAYSQIDPNRFVDGLEAAFGKFEGFRRSGAKGICADGEFVGSAEGRALSTASAFSGRAVPVIVRFSVGGANPNAPDNSKSQRNMALQFNLPDGELWQMGNISAPVFSVATPTQFMASLESQRLDPSTKAPDAAKVKAFTDAHPEALQQGRYFASQPVPASFGSVNYWGVHAFGFVNERSHTQWGKWVFEPTGGTVGLSDEESKAKGPTFLVRELRERVQAGTVAFDFMVQLAQPGDRIDIAVVPLPADRTKVNLGRLRITTVSPDATGPCLTILFNPMLLPNGVEASSDPLLSARSAPYSIGVARRLMEGPKQ
jgi:catalase